jgi:selenide,water dikinase
MGPGDLAHVLRPLKTHKHPALLVGLEISDDAAVYALTPDQALVQTLDFFPPIVDDAYQFGAIAAANALSDIYAMGGRPILGLNIAAWPDSLPYDLLTAVFQGGADKVAEAGAVVAGGHTVIDKEPKYGLCVTGLVHPDRLLTKGGARPGDVLVLTKPLGTGVITTAAKNDRVDPAHLNGAVASMLRLNGVASEALVAAGVRAATDITGFGLLGHAAEMAAAAGVCFEIDSALAPALPGALQYIAAGLTPGGIARNYNYLLKPDEPRPDDGHDHLLPGLPPDPTSRVIVSPGVDDDLVTLLLDPQTSGGLFAAVRPDRIAALEDAMADRALPHWRVGGVRAGRGVLVR